MTIDAGRLLKITLSRHQLNGPPKMAGCGPALPRFERSHSIIGGLQELFVIRQESENALSKHEEYFWEESYHRSRVAHSLRHSSREMPSCLDGIQKFAIKVGVVSRLHLLGDRQCAQALLMMP